MARRALEEGFKYNAIIISQRFARYVSLRIAFSAKVPAMVKVYDLLFFTDNSSRFLLRILIYALIEFGGTVAVLAGSTLVNVVPATVLLIIASFGFDLSQDCGVSCDQYQSVRELTRSANEQIEVLVERESEVLYEK